MRIAICGLSSLARYVAHELVYEGKEIVLLDDNDDQLELFANELGGVQWYAGDCTLPECQEAAGMSKCDALFALTGSDQKNILTCQIGHSLFKVKRKFAHIKNSSYQNPLWSGLFSSENIAIDHVISPEKQIAQKISFYLQYPELQQIFLFKNDLLKSFRIRIKRGSKLEGISYTQCIEKYKIPFMCPLLRRNNVVSKTEKEIPFKAGDDLYIIIKDQDVKDIYNLNSCSIKKIDRVLIAGAGSIGSECARVLRHEYDISVVEQDSSQLLSFVEEFKDVDIYTNDVLSMSLLFKKSNKKFDCSLLLTDNDCVNFLVSSLHIGMDFRHSLFLYSEKEHIEYLNKVRSDRSILVNPSEDIIGIISASFRAGNIISINKIFYKDLEIIEGCIPDSSSIIGVRLSAIIYDFHNFYTIQCLIRNKDVFFADFEDISSIKIQAKDILILIGNFAHSSYIERLFSFS